MLAAKPKSALIYVTNACNLDCHHCGPSAGAEVIDSSALMDMETLTTVIRRCHAAGVSYISLTGGEPLMVKNLAAVIRATRTEGLKIAINSNLTFLPHWIEELVAEGAIYEFCVSIDGAVSTTHDRLRGTGTFEKTVSNICRVQKIAKGVDHPLKISFTTVPTAYNHTEINDIVELAVELDVDQVQFEHLGLSGNADIYANELTLSGQNLLDVYDCILTHVRSPQAPHVRSNMITNAFIDYYNNHHGTDHPYKYFSCTSPQRFIYVSYDGSLAPCSAMTDQITGRTSGDGADCLNLARHSLGETLASDPVRDFITQKTSLEVQRRMKPCNRCRFLGNYCSPCISEIIRGRKAVYALCVESLSAMGLN